jgi:Cys-tRNA(Pro) deacylase
MRWLPADRLRSSYNLPMDYNHLPAARDLAGRGVAFTLFVHSGPVRSLEQAAEERGQRPEQVVRSIVFRTGEESFLMVLMAGPGQIPWKALRAHLGQSRLTMATEEELLRVTGCVPGTVNPFGLPAPMPVLIDRGVLAQEEVSLGSGRRGVAIRMKSADLLRAVEDVEVVNFSGPEAT